MLGYLHIIMPPRTWYKQALIIIHRLLPPLPFLHHCPPFFIRPGRATSFTVLFVGPSAVAVCLSFTAEAKLSTTLPAPQILALSTPATRP
ncbi:hypothetical protein DFH08DRAFT_962117 [Mycena albidolilacea]|uniref:Uncharacterized protein n=1 Tax=Mycena albidolilacea TaxID=1033008 RepID=A0AAD7EQR0_9AGAR|nr:hypothetical protein DFH08DRAFT_962117 [Mycena albidolilacea]